MLLTLCLGKINNKIGQIKGLRKRREEMKNRYDSDLQVDERKNIWITMIFIKFHLKTSLETHNGKANMSDWLTDLISPCSECSHSNCHNVSEIAFANRIGVLCAAIAWARRPGEDLDSLAKLADGNTSLEGWMCPTGRTREETHLGHERRCRGRVGTDAHGDWAMDSWVAGSCCRRGTRKAAGEWNHCSTTKTHCIGGSRNCHRTCAWAATRLCDDCPRKRTVDWDRDRPEEWTLGWREAQGAETGDEHPFCGIGLNWIEHSGGQEWK